MPTMDVQVRSYKTEGQLERDIRRREAKGWTMRTTLATHTPGHVNVAATFWKTVLTGGLYLIVKGFSRKKGQDKYTVTWERDKFYDVDHY